MQDEPSPDETPPPDSAQDKAHSSTADSSGSDAEVIGDSNALDLVDQAMQALDQDDLELAEELADQLQDRPSDEG